MRLPMLLLLVVTCSAANAQTRTPLSAFLDLTSDRRATRVSALNQISENWNDGDSTMLIESARFARDAPTRVEIVKTLRKQTDQTFSTDLDRWYRWSWNQELELHPGYALFKKALYARLDPRFADYFSDSFDAEIRLDEIRWGGVRRDGIPPLKNPQTIPAVAATYLADSDVVFGVEFGGQARAYPKRILAWHEMVKDDVGGRSINGVYCTLCGSMIVYDTKFQDKHYELGTSGFLYRSNKLMYDHETKSLWSTLRGAPVVGPLVGKGIELNSLHVVTTTWGKWKEQHPDTDVLSLNTGHRRNYGEGVAYASYFATDDLMFAVPKRDKRLKNKDEVLIVRGPSETPRTPMAISASFLDEHPVYHNQLGDVSFVVVTDDAGANRVYASGDTRFEQPADDETIVSSDGVAYRITEDSLMPIDSDVNEPLRRLSAHRAFWFGWVAAYPDTNLIK